MRRAPDRPYFVGVIHLLPLPGGPRPSAGLDAVLARAVADALALVQGGADALVVENFGDAPFGAGAVEPFTVAAMTRASLAVRAAAPGLGLGVNVLRNDARSALGIAAAVGADFIRVNVHTGAMVTDQGVIQGDARATLLERNRLARPIRIVADVHVKHAAPLGAQSIEDAARDAATRGQADVLVVTGAGTGIRTEPERWTGVRRVVPGVPVWVGSGLHPDSVADYPDLDGAIVGTWLHEAGELDAPLDVDRVRRMRRALG